MTSSVRRIAARICVDLGLADQELSILLTNDAEIRRLNFAYRGKDHPTDVLSFSQIEGESMPAAKAQLGDVVISLETASRQARERRQTLKAELQQLLVHGILHLLGHNHVNGGQASRAMRLTEQHLLKLLARKTSGRRQHRKGEK